MRPDTLFGYRARVLWTSAFFNEASFFFQGARQHHVTAAVGITWDRLRVCNKLCCTVLLRTKLMLRGFALCRNNYWLPHGAASAGLRRWRSRNRCLHPLLLPVSDLFASAAFCHSRQLMIDFVSRRRRDQTANLWQTQSSYYVYIQFVRALFFIFFPCELTSIGIAVSASRADEAITWRHHVVWLGARLRKTDGFSRITFLTNADFFLFYYFFLRVVTSFIKHGRQAASKQHMFCASALMFVRHAVRGA